MLDLAPLCPTRGLQEIFMPLNRDLLSPVPLVSHSHSLAQRLPSFSLRTLLRTERTAANAGASRRMLRRGQLRDGFPGVGRVRGPRTGLLLVGKAKQVNWSRRSCCCFLVFCFAPRY